MRHRVSFRLVFDDGGGFCMGTVVDISASGVLLRIDGDIEAGKLVKLHPVGAAGEILFDLRARVVRIAARDEENGWCDAGLEFVSVDQRRLTALRRIFAEMPETNDEDFVVEEREAPPEVQARDLPHHRIRARIPPTSRREPKWARRPL